MDPLTLIGIATASLSLARASGLVRTAADKLAAETAADIKGLVLADFSAALGALDLAAHTDSDRECAEQLRSAAELSRNAETQDRLPPSMRGFAAALLAALLVRGNDRGGAELMVVKAVDHYHQAYQEVHELARQVIVSQRRWRAARLPSVILLGPALGPVLGPAAVRRALPHTSRSIPSESWTDEVGRQAAEVRVFALRLGLAVPERAVGITLERDNLGSVTSSVLEFAPSIGPRNTDSFRDRG